MSALVAFVAVGCKKKVNSVSTEVTVSYPTISFAGGNVYFSIPVGGGLPAISATAYDSFYKEVDNVVLDQSTLDNTTPGLYIVSATAQNKYGFTGTANVYVAVTNINSAINLAGTYARIDNSSNYLVTVSKLANGLYMSSNMTGNPAAVDPGVFVQTDDTTIIVPSQVTPGGTLYGTNAKVSMAVADTTYRYILGPSSNFSQSTRIFQKQ